MRDATRYRDGDDHEACREGICEQGKRKGHGRAMSKWRPLWDDWGALWIATVTVLQPFPRWLLAFVWGFYVGSRFEGYRLWLRNPLAGVKFDPEMWRLATEVAREAMAATHIRPSEGASDTHATSSSTSP